jgi:hypothetical protein
MEIHHAINGKIHYKLLSSIVHPLFHRSIDIHCEMLRPRLLLGAHLVDLTNCRNESKPGKLCNKHLPKKTTDEVPKAFLRLQQVSDLMTRSEFEMILH